MSTISVADWERMSWHARMRTPIDRRPQSEMRRLVLVDTPVDTVAARVRKPLRRNDSRPRLRIRRDWRACWTLTDGRNTAQAANVHALWDLVARLDTRGAA